MSCSSRQNLKYTKQKPQFSVNQKMIDLEDEFTLALPILLIIQMFTGVCVVCIVRSIQHI